MSTVTDLVVATKVRETLSSVVSYEVRRYLDIVGHGDDPVLKHLLGKYTRELVYNDPIAIATGLKYITDKASGFSKKQLRPLSIELHTMIYEQVELVCESNVECVKYIQAKTRLSEYCDCKTLPYIRRYSTIDNPFPEWNCLELSLIVLPLGEEQIISLAKRDIKERS